MFGEAGSADNVVQLWIERYPNLQDRDCNEEIEALDSSGLRLQIEQTQRNKLSGGTEWTQLS